MAIALRGKHRLANILTLLSPLVLLWNSIPGSHTGGALVVAHGTRLWSAFWRICSTCARCCAQTPLPDELVGPFGPDRARSPLPPTLAKRGCIP